MEFFRQLAAGVRETWTRLPRRAQFNIGVATGLVVVLLAALVTYNARPEFVLLYDGLSREDSIAIRTYLDEEGVTYRVKRDGGLIEVPFRDRGRVMQSLTDRDLPKRYGRLPGFDRFDETDLMTNKYLLDVRYMQAIHEQLQNTLNAYDFVNYSIVTINEAEESIFTDYQKPSEAAVVLDLKRYPTDREIKGILHTIGAAGGAELDDSNITLTSTDGDVLWLPRQDEFTALAGTLQEHKSSEERRLEDKIKKFFDQSGIRAVVTVAAQVDTKRVNEIASVVTDGAVIAEDTSNRELNTTESLPQGPTGASANPPAGAESPPTADTTETETTSTVNFEPSITNTTTTSEPGAFTGFSVAALISGGTETQTDDEGNESVVYQPLSDDEKENYRTAIAKMIDPTMNAEDVYVADLPMEEALGQPATPGIFTLEGFEAFWGTQSGRMAMNAMLLVAIFLAFLLIRYYLRSAIVIPEEIEEDLEAEAAEDIEPDLTKEMLERLEEAAMSEPEMFAAMLRTWMTDAGREN